MSTTTTNNIRTSGGEHSGPVHQSRSATQMEIRRAKAIGLSAFLVMFMLTVAIAFTAIAINWNGEPVQGKPDPDPQPPPTASWLIPVEGTFNKEKGFCDTTLQYNVRQSEWRAHLGVTLSAEAGTRVVAPMDGTVKLIDNTFYGREVWLQHDNGLVSVFKSLESNVPVTQGQRVTRGQRIGYVGTTSIVEFANIPHVRIEMLRDGIEIDPATYIDFDVEK